MLFNIYLSILYYITVKMASLRNNLMIDINFCDEYDHDIRLMKFYNIMKFTTCGLVVGSFIAISVAAVIISNKIDFIIH